MGPIVEAFVKRNSFGWLPLEQQPKHKSLTELQTKRKSQCSLAVLVDAFKEATTSNVRKQSHKLKLPGRYYPGQQVQVNIAWEKRGDSCSNSRVKHASSAMLILTLRI